jgi:integrase
VNEVLDKWLNEFKSPSTKTTYRFALKKFQRTLGIDDLGAYVKSKPDALNDMRRFLKALEGKPSKTIKTYAGAVKVFLQDHENKIPDEEWRKLRRRGFMPKRVRAETKDKKPTKPQLKRILNYSTIKGRSLVLFLCSSGARLGETLQLKKRDFNFDADPPEAHMRSEYTKSGVGGRTVLFSYEAKNAILDWLEIKESIHKRSGDGTYGGERVFPFSKSNAQWMWNKACDHADLGVRDEYTRRRKYHLHSLRKFFRTNIGIDLDHIHMLMGHAEYLDEAYLREEWEKIAQAYKEAMPNVSVFEVESQDLKHTVEDLEQQLHEMRNTVKRLVGMPPEEIEDMVNAWKSGKLKKEVRKAFKPPKQKIIAEAELDKYLNEGWVYINSLNNGSGKCIVAKP